MVGCPRFGGHIRMSYLWTARNKIGCCIPAPRILPLSAGPTKDKLRPRLVFSDPTSWNEIERVVASR